MAKPKLGDIIVIPLNDNKHFAISKILYISNYFKHVMLIGVYGVEIDKEEIPQNLPSEFIALVYTDVRPVKKGIWKIISQSDIDENESKLSTRIVAGDLWVGDEVLRRASDEDLKEWPKMVPLLKHQAIDKITEILQGIK